MAMKKKYYAVLVGQVPGIYTKWEGSKGAKVQVHEFPGAKYQSFYARSGAQDWLDRDGEEVRPKVKRAITTKLRSEALSPLESADTGYVRVYTDGACLNNPGRGGLAVIISCDGQRIVHSAGYRRTTNNRMELMACIVGLQMAPQGRPIIVFSDSKYVVDCISKGWAKRWRKSGWILFGGGNAKNTDLWATLLDLVESREAQFRWVQGHAGHPENERCDQLANAAASGSNLSVDPAYKRKTRVRKG